MVHLRPAIPRLVSMDMASVVLQEVVQEVKAEASAEVALHHPRPTRTQTSMSRACPIGARCFLAMARLRACAAMRAAATASHCSFRKLPVR